MADAHIDPTSQFTWRILYGKYKDLLFDISSLADKYAQSTWITNLSNDFRDRKPGVVDDCLALMDRSGADSIGGTRRTLIAEIIRST